MPKKKPSRAKALPAPNFPPTHPEALAMLADAEPWKTTARGFPLETYHKTIHKLKQRGFTYAGIADFLNQHLAADLGKRRITRGQVYRVYQQWLEITDQGPTSVAHISDEEAERVASDFDQKTPTPENS